MLCDHLQHETESGTHNATSVADSAELQQQEGPEMTSGWARGQKKAADLAAKLTKRLVDVNKTEFC